MKTIITEESRLMIFAENSIDHFALEQWAKKVRKILKKHPYAKPLEVIDIDVSAYLVNSVPE